MASGQTPEEGITLVGEPTSLLPLGRSDIPSDIPPAAEDVVHAEGRAPADEVVGARITAWAFLPGQEPTAVDLADVPALLGDDERFVWVDVTGYGAADLAGVRDALQLHPRVAHAMLSPWHRPTLMVFPDQVYISVTIPRLDERAFRVEAGELDLCLGRNFLVSVHKQPLPFLARVQARAQQTPDLVRRDTAYHLYILLDELLAYYEELNRRVQDDVERIEERALRDPSDTFLEDLLHFKRYVFALGQIADQHRQVFAAFLRPDFSWVSGADVEMYYRDLDTRLDRLLGMLTANKDAANSAFDIYVSHMAHRTNQIIKVLTMVSTVILPATLLIALFGASLQGVLPRLGAIWLLGALVSIALLGAAILYEFHRRGWL